MANQTFHLSILTPYGHYFDGDVEFLEVHSSEYNLGILPGHAPLISTVAISKMRIKAHGREMLYAVGGGVITINSEKTTLVLDSIERADEIDLERAKEAKQRAEERLSTAEKENAVDVNRARLALMKAINRIEVGSKH
ncbi:MAG: F0F1 ATP synthase subunit epsilon [Bacilli bacterium]|nr:F0F1 ATP synthase subunit epsilon [Bacilli bacterium]